MGRPELVSGVDVGSSRGSDGTIGVGNRCESGEEGVSGGVQG